MDADTIAKIVAFSKSSAADRGEDFIKPMVPRKSEPLTNFSNSHKELAAGFGRSEGEIREWLESKFFKPYWKTYLDECVNTARKKVAAASTVDVFSVDLQTVVATVQHGERYGMVTYSTDHPAKDRWTDLDHLAFFLFRCHRENKNNRSGFLFDKDWTQFEQYHAIWQAMEFRINAYNGAKMEGKTKAGEKRKRDDKEE